MFRTGSLLVALLLTFAVPLPAAAQALIESYVAHLSARDHFNSDGVRLTSAAAIIRQDRANYHRFGLRDPADEWDSFFSSAANRARLEQMLDNAASTPGFRSIIVNGEPYVRVELYGYDGRVTRVRVVIL